MNWRNLANGLGRGFTAAQIAGQLATVPITKDGTSDLVKQYANYSRHLKLEDIHRQARKDTSKTYVPIAVLDKRMSKKLRKP